MDWSACSVVELVAGQVGGAPVVNGTRLPIEAILDNFDCGVEPAEIAEMFEVDIGIVHTILEFRERH